MSDLMTLWPHLMPGPAGLDFFQVMRRVECAYSHQPRLGTSLRNAQDPLRVGQEVTLNFSGVDLKTCACATDSSPGRLTLSSGLVGTDGPMPLHLTEYVSTRLTHHGDRAWVAFLDVFHHRMACLRYHAWAAAQPAVSFDRPHDNVFGRYVGSLCGVAYKSLSSNEVTQAFPLGAWLADRRRSAAGLTALLQSYFALPVRIEPFIGQWLPIPTAQRARLSRRLKLKLGHGQPLGRRIWDRQHKFRVSVGPVDFKLTLQLQPGTRAFTQLASWIQSYTSGVHDWDLELRLIANTLKPTRLGPTTRLARNTWLGRPGLGRTCVLRFAAPIARRSGRMADARPAGAS